VSNTKIIRPRGRPRRFDIEEAVGTAQALFHARGYDAVGVADVADSLGIKLPSFYAAFGSKVGLFDRVLDRYGQTGAVPLTRILRPGRPLAEALADVLEEAARSYAADPVQTGCIVLEALRCNDPTARDAARTRHIAAQGAIHDYIFARNPEDAERLTDFVCTTMAGLSASARDGQSVERLLATARLAGSALAQTLGR
jgi:TetR/AcrR family transcriptional regulator, repressor for divergent bdcA